MLVSMMYHFIHSSDDQPIFRGLHGISLIEFEKQLAFLCDNFTAVTHKDLCNHIQEGSPLPERGFTLTFDDGIKQHFNNVLPALKSFGLEGSFFIPTQPLIESKIHLLEKQRLCQYCIFGNYSEFLDQFYQHSKLVAHNTLTTAIEPSKSNIERAASYLAQHGFYTPEERFYRQLREEIIPEQVFSEIINSLFTQYFDEVEVIQDYYINSHELLELSNHGMVIGGHTHSHPHLEKLEDTCSLREIETGLNHLEQLVGYKIGVFSYPFGTYNEKTIGQLEDLRMIYSYTTKNCVNENISKRFELTRVDAANFASLSALALGSSIGESKAKNNFEFKEAPC